MQNAKCWMNIQKLQTTRHQFNAFKDDSSTSWMPGNNFEIFDYIYDSSSPEVLIKNTSHLSMTYRKLHKIAEFLLGSDSITANSSN